MATEYKCYHFDGTSTYTDISDYIIGNVNIPALHINPDQSLIIDNMNIETVTDLTGSSLADDEIICFSVNTGTEKKIWYGYVESSNYSYDSKTWNYNIFNIFENLKNKTCYTDLYPNITGLGTARSSSIYSGSSAIAWRDITLKTLIEHIMEHSDYTGVTHTVTWSYGTGFLKTILENFCVSSLCIKNLGTDYSDDELTAVSSDPDIKVWDLLSELFKILGLRYYYTDALAITIAGSDTATAGTDYKGAGYDDGKWVNKYSYQVKKLKELKKFVLKQNILNITDYPESDIEPHRYFTPIIYGLPNMTFNTVEQSSADVIITVGDINGTRDHKLPATDNTMFNTLKMVNQLETELNFGDEWNYEDTDQIRLYNRDVQEFRHLRTNIVPSAVYDMDAVTVRLNEASVDYMDITLSDTNTLNVDQYDLILDSYTNVVRVFNGTYTYASSGTTSGTYLYVDSTHIRVYKEVLSYFSGTSYFTNCGTVTEVTGVTAGDPQYIIKTVRTTDSGVDVILIYCQSHGVVTTDTLHIFGTSEIDGNYTEQTTLGDLATGEYYIRTANQIYILDEGQALEEYGFAKVEIPKYQNYANLTDGKEDKNINWTDYLVIYRPPDWSGMAAGWRKDWFAIDMEDATYCLLMNYASYVPWWYYTFSSDYQTITSETFNLDDTVTPVMTTARKISYNVDDNSIDIEQDS